MGIIVAYEVRPVDGENRTTRKEDAMMFSIFSVAKTRFGGSARNWITACETEGEAWEKARKLAKNQGVVAREWTGS